MFGSPADLDGAAAAPGRKAQALFGNTDKMLAHLAGGRADRTPSPASPATPVPICWPLQ